MRRRKKRRPAATVARPRSFANRPFGELHPVSTVGRDPAPVPEPAPAEPVRPASEADIFADAMSGVARLSADRSSVVATPVEPARRPAVEGRDAAALGELSDLVSGVGAFDITDTTEFIEGTASGVDPGLLRRLRRGEFAFRHHLDLHGMTVAEAREAVDGFLRYATGSRERCVLIVHGRGLNSPDKLPVLKRHLVDWLSRGPWARGVLAFTSARPCDGGAGAMYVLMRRTRDGKKQMRVTEGAKW